MSGLVLAVALIAAAPRTGEDATPLPAIVTISAKTPKAHARVDHVTVVGAVE